MKTLGTALLKMLPATAMVIGLSLSNQAVFAQNPNTTNDPTTQQQPMQQPDAQNSASESKTFTGKILKADGKLVLSDMDSKTTYQLDDQQKAQAFVNKTVKVTGVLDASTGVIHISAIEPA